MPDWDFRKPEPVRIICHKPGASGLAEIGKCAERGAVAIHREYSLGQEQDLPLPFFHLAPGITDVVMPEGTDRRPRQPGAGMHTSVAELIHDDCIARPDERGYGPDIGKISRSEEACGFGFPERREPLLDLIRQRMIACDETRSPRAHAVTKRSRARCFDEPRVAGEREIVIVAERNHFLPAALGPAPRKPDRRLQLASLSGGVKPFELCICIGDQAF